MRQRTVPTAVLRFRAAVGSNIKRRRVERGLSQLELARAAGMATQASLSNYENGKRDIPLVLAVAVATVLDVPLSQLLREG